MGVFYPYNRGALFTALVVIYALTSGIAGYVATNFYCQLEGTNWVSCTNCPIWCNSFGAIIGLQKNCFPWKVGPEHVLLWILPEISFCRSEPLSITVALSCIGQQPYVSLREKCEFHFLKYLNLWGQSAFCMSHIVPSPNLFCIALLFGEFL